MQRVAFRASAPTPAPQGRVLTGLALPYGVEASSQHPAFHRGVLVEYGHPKPLLLEHDITQKVGTVTTLWETDEGVHFTAVLDAPAGELPAHLSVGGEYVIENDNITALYIFEVSLTSSPAYVETNYKIVAHMNDEVKKLQEELAQVQAKLAQVSAKQTGRITAQEALPEAMSALEERVMKLEERVAALEVQLAEMKSAAEEALQASKRMVENYQRVIATVQGLWETEGRKLVEFEAARLNGKFSLVLEKLEKFLKIAQS